MVRILHTADLHLGNAFTSGFLSYDIYKKRQDDLLNTFDNIIKTAQEEKTELLLISGDLFEHRYVQKNTVEYVNEQFKGLKGTHIFILPGNHDPYHLTPYYKSFPWANNVYLFTDEYKEYHLKDLRVVLHGMGFGYQEEPGAILENLYCKETEDIHILMIHGSDMSLAPQKASKYLPFNQEDLEKSGFDYIALGHYHQHRFFHNSYGNIIAAYPGSPEPLAFDETGQHGIIIGNVRKERNQISFLPISARAYYVLDIEISDCNSINSIKEKIVHKISPLNPTQNLFSINIKGSYTWALGESINIIENQCRENAFYIRLNDCTIPDYDIDRIIQEDSLLSSYIIEIQHRIRQEPDPDQREKLKKALNFGIEAFRGGRYQA